MKSWLTAAGALRIAVALVAILGAFALGRSTGQDAVAQLRVYHHVKTVGPPGHHGMVSNFATADGAFSVWFPAGSWEDCRLPVDGQCRRSDAGEIITSTCLETAKSGSYVDVAVVEIDPVDAMPGVFTGVWVRCLPG